MKVAISTVLAAPAQRIWQAAQTTALLHYVSGPMVTFHPKAPLPERWADGRYLVGMRLFGVLPIGEQWIVIEHVEVDERGGRYVLRDNGYSGMIRRWDHHITLSARADGRSDYRDSLDLDAGPLTPFVWLFAQAFYRHRQSRWRRLVSEDFAPLAGRLG